MKTRRGRLLAALLGAALGCDDYFYVCPVADDDKVAHLPARLSETGLYDRPGELAAGVLAYRPGFELWADGADKRRFVQLPPGAVIDTSDMDAWRFPVGTRVWKEFSRGGRPLETRLLQRIGPSDSDWAALAYVWRPDGLDADAQVAGYLDAGGTEHDVPSAGECVACHGGRPSFVLGVSAIQLSEPAAAGEVDLARLGELELLSDPPDGPFTIPGDETERAALGYLHANCSHCHNQHRPGASPCMDPEISMDLFLAVADLAAVDRTGTYRTVVGHQIAPGHPDRSELIERAGTRELFYRMPPLGSAVVDAESVALLERWIEAMR